MKRTIHDFGFYDLANELKINPDLKSRVVGMSLQVAQGMGSN